MQNRFNNLKDGTYRFPPPIIIGPEEVWYMEGRMVWGIPVTIGTTRLLVRPNERLVTETSQNNNQNNELN